MYSVRRRNLQHNPGELVLAVPEWNLESFGRGLVHRVPGGNVRAGLGLGGCDGVLDLPRRHEQWHQGQFLRCLSVGSVELRGLARLRVLPGGHAGREHDNALRDVPGGNLEPSRLNRVPAM